MAVQQTTTITLRLLDGKGQEVRREQVRSGTNPWALIRRWHLPIGAACSGVGICGACAVTVLEGMEHFEAPSELEERTKTLQGKGDSTRILCLCRLKKEGPGVVTLQSFLW